MRSVRLACVSLVVWVAPSSGGSVDDREQVLAHMGPHDVGFTSLIMADASRGGRQNQLLIWYPAGDVAGRPLASYPTVVPAPPILITLPFHFDAEDLAGFVEGRLEYQDAPPAAGAHPVVVHLAGGGAPGLVYLFEGIKLASHGFVFVSVTHPDAVPCNLDGDARWVLDTLLAWNQTPGHRFQGAFDADAIFGAGHSLGGRTWIARTSTETECGLEREERIRGLALKDATREALTLGQVQANFTPMFLDAQFCRPTQIALQQDLGSKPKMLTLAGVCPTPSGLNHSLFSQSCMTIVASLNAGNPRTSFPPALLAMCFNPSAADRARCPDVVSYRDKELFFAQQTTKFTIAYLRTLMGENQYGAVLAPGRAGIEPGVFLINTAIGAGNDETVVVNANQVLGIEGFCTQPGSDDDGESPKIEL
jgi:hypothetical protein